MSCLICGSLAYDTISDYPGRFADHILPDRIHRINVAFDIPTLRREFGGCAGNIAYTLRMLGGEPVVLAALGRDGGDYEARLDALGISRAHLRVSRELHTAQAHIMTDRDNNQITGFHPGAMLEAHLRPVPALPGLKLGIVAPDSRQAMLDHAAQMAAAELPFIFDPGQALPLFDADDLRVLVAQASWAVLNDYEAAMLLQRIGGDAEALAAQLRGLVVTRGAEGCEVYTQGRMTRVPALPAATVVDPTGCGDAFRGALLWALEQGWELVDACRLGNVLGACKIASAGPQNHVIDLAEALATMRRVYDAAA